jgi:uncharacterized protein
VKKLNFVIAGLLVALSAPTAAQFVSTSYEFLKAVRERDGNKVTELLQSGQPGLINMRGDDGNTALIIAVARRDNDWVAFLISKGADVNLPARNGDTPLTTAARVGFEEAVEWLLSAGARVDTPNRMGETPLILAVQRRQVPIVKVLLNAGANPDKADTAAGLTARDYAARDTRSRQMLQLIEAKKPKSASAAK